MSRIILASASPRRRELLLQIGLQFEVVESACEEKIESSLPEEVVCELSRQKAQDVWERLQDEKAVVIGADTVVAFDGRILGKPKDEAEACLMLQSLSGNTHQVYTGVTICYTAGGSMLSHTFYEKTEVDFYPMDEKEIRDYVTTGDPLDKAGAYGIQGRCAAYIKGIRGDYNNVVGLPVGRLYQELKECLPDEESGHL
ncbi:MAG: septum formation inhibitor Maf [Lachnospiraceae bacterium]|nr:septum formation inhibitor Maf [Lachnospiraceae bacterium]